MFLSQDKSKKKRLQKPNILRRNPKIFKSINKSLELSKDKSADTCPLLETDTKNEFKNNFNIKKSTEVNVDQRVNLNVSEVETKPSCLIPFHSDVTDMVVLQPSFNIDSFLIRHSEEQNIALIKNKQGTDDTIDKVCLAFIDDSNPLIVGNCRRLKEFYNSDKININSIIPQAIFSGRTESMHSANDCTTICIEGITQSRTKYKCDEGDCEKVFLSEEKLLKHKNTHKLCRIARQSVFECPVKNSCKVKANCENVFLTKEELIKHINEDHTVDDAAYKCDECERGFFWASGLRAHKRSHVERATFACPWPECGRVFRHACRLREHSRAHTGAKPYHCTYPNCGWSFRTASKLLRHSRRHTGDRRHTCAQCGRAFLRREHLRDHEARHHALEAASNAENGTSDINEVSKQHKVMKNRDKSMKKVKRKQCTGQNTSNDSENDTSRGLKKSGQKFTVELWEGNQSVKSFGEHPELSVPDIRNELSMESKSGEMKDFLLGPESFEEADFVAPIPEEGKDLVITRGEREFVIASGVGGEGNFVIANAEDFVIQARDEGEDLVITSQFDGDRDFVLTSGPDEGDLLVRDQDASDGHAARTHCTWPLPHKGDFNSPDDYVLGDDVQVEPLEGAESNVFTVRSDLFLHGSVFHNEDSEQMCSTVRASVSERALDSELMLDAPSVHLAQEELYTDAVDESSFRVFLLSGEELA